MVVEGGMVTTANDASAAEDSAVKDGDSECKTCEYTTVNGHVENNVPLEDVAEYIAKYANGIKGKLAD
jgi:hypothetical protein